MRSLGPVLLVLLGGCGFLDDLFGDDRNTADEPTRGVDTAGVEPGDSGITIGVETGDSGALPTGDTTIFTTPPEAFSLADDVALAKVSVYQGVERPLWEDGAPVDSDVPVISDREALVRVFLDPDPGFVTRDLRVSLVLQNGSGPITRARIGRVSGPSSDADRNSTFEFVVDASELTGVTELRVAVTEADVETPGNGAPERTVFVSATDLPGGLPVEAGEDIVIVILPFRYTADESNREPDLNPQVLAELKAFLESLWPVREVTVQIGDTVEWDQDILGTGDGFEAALFEVEERRKNASVSRNTHFYGMFDPADSYAEFCDGTCTVGLAYTPGATSAPQYRTAVGVGFTDTRAVTEWTLGHEASHALGRSHAPCGSGVVGIDSSYPYGDGSIGTWGYDRRTDLLLEPTTTFDVMGYCQQSWWISDYHFEALHERAVALSIAPAAPARTVTALRVDGANQVTAVTDARLHGPATGMGRPVTVELVDEQGTGRGVRTGWRVGLSHLPGGVVLLDEALPDGWTARVR